jgi:predicted patatin/cPLA2 family phospholipase
MNVLVVEGGALRSVYSAGVLDGFLQQSFNPFELAIGVSAGASNLLFYLSGKKGQSIELFKQVAQHREFISYMRFLRGGHLLDMDWLFRQPNILSIINDKNVNLRCPLIVGLTQVSNGTAVYKQCSHQNSLILLKASMSLPLLYRGFPVVSGRAMTDGGIADGIPIAEAIKRGARKIMLIRSRHQDYQKTDSAWHLFIRWKLRDQQALAETMRQRVAIHQQTCQLISQPPAGVKIIDICPPQTFAMGRFSRTKDDLMRGYRTGVEDSQRAIEQWKHS